MVRAILDGGKTQTRRIIKPQPDNRVTFCPYSKTGWSEELADGRCRCDSKPVKCPFGSPGDRLWVRETWAHSVDNPVMGSAGEIAYRATDAGRDSCPGFRWKPSIFMPRSISRIILEVTDVQVERLQNISDANCRNEGCCHRGWNVTDWKHPLSETGWSIERSNFASLWESINGPNSWAANPWVWVIEFSKA